MHDEKLKPAAEPALRTTSAGWSSRLDRGALQTVLLSIIAGVMILAALDGASLIAVPTVLAVLCAIALVPAMRWLERTRAPASLCAAFVVGGLLLGAAFTAYALAPSAEAWNDRAPQVLRDAERRTREIVSGISRTLDVEAPVAPAADPGVALSAEPADPAEPELGDDAVGRLVEGGQRLLTDLAIGAPRIAAGAAFWAMLTFFLLRDRVMLARWGMSVVSGASARRAVGRAMRDVRINVARYLLAITAINLGLGVCVAVAFQLLGVSNAPLWGVAAALLNFMPFIGIALLMLVTLGVGISSFEDPIIAFAPFAVIVALNIVESQVVTPMVVGARIRIAPVAVFVAIAFGAWLWGAGGALVATPTLIVAVAFAERLNAAAHLSQSPRQRESRQKGRQRQ
ncbi:AI-2E family transporter [Tropicimonas sp. IMCC6043]|uniref:AI-2E family transporter n=1 Tax=Tropicimonas sp. IMCC6043 TaxID=2510645 RepID=UPI0021100C1A|nr:AI-2E family transporter [Tropicimonas sp. IMCC6043]